MSNEIQWFCAGLDSIATMIFVCATFGVSAFQIGRECFLSVIAFLSVSAF
jgi:hypothetical protein